MDENRNEDDKDHPGLPDNEQVSSICVSITRTSPSCPPDFLKIMQFSGNLRKPLILSEQMLGSRPPWGQNSAGPLDQNPGSASVASPCETMEFELLNLEPSLWLQRLSLVWANNAYCRDTLVFHLSYSQKKYKVLVSFECWIPQKCLFVAWFDRE